MPICNTWGDPRRELKPTPITDTSQIGPSPVHVTDYDP